MKHLGHKLKPTSRDRLQPVTSTQARALQMLVLDQRPLNKSQAQSYCKQNSRYSHNRKDLWEDDAGFCQILVEDALVELVRGVLHQRGLPGKEPSVHLAAHTSAKGFQISH